MCQFLLRVKRQTPFLIIKTKNVCIFLTDLHSKDDKRDCHIFRRCSLFVCTRISDRSTNEYSWKEIGNILFTSWLNMNFWNVNQQLWKNEIKVMLFSVRNRNSENIKYSSMKETFLYYLKQNCWDEILNCIVMNYLLNSKLKKVIWKHTFLSKNLSNTRHLKKPLLRTSVIQTSNKL